jgi:hypothetical protein
MCRRGGFRVGWKFRGAAAKGAIHFAALTARLEAAPFQSKAEKLKAERRSESTAERRRQGGEAER